MLKVEQGQTQCTYPQLFPCHWTRLHPYSLWSSFRLFGEYCSCLWLASSVLEELAMILIMAAMKCGNKKAAREDLTTQEKNDCVEVITLTHHQASSQGAPTGSSEKAPKPRAAESIDSWLACRVVRFFRPCHAACLFPGCRSSGGFAWRALERFLSTPWGCQEADIYYRHGQKNNLQKLE